MQVQKGFVTLWFVFVLAAVARADRVTSDYDHAVKFSNYKTFMWIQEPESKEPFMKERIMASVSAELTARGMRQVNDGADLAVGANTGIEEKHTWEDYYDGTRWGWDPGLVTKVRTYEVGTLIVDLFDAERRKLIWQAVSTDTVSHKPDKRVRETGRQIEKMFREFPPPETGH
jgi:hypothetical protein